MTPVELMLIGLAIFAWGVAMYWLSEGMAHADPPVRERAPSDNLLDH